MTRLSIYKEVLEMRIEGTNDLGYIPPSPSKAEPTQSTEVKREPTPIKNQQVELDAGNKSSDQEKPQSEHEVIMAIEKANKHFKMYDRRLEFSIHDVTKQIMVKVIDTENDQVIREIPSEKILDMVAHLWQISGVLVDEKR